MSLRKNHMFMAAALLTYTREGAAKQRHMNVVMALPDKKVTAADLNEARLMLIQRLYQENGVVVADLHDIIFLSVSHLGLMSSKEFNNIPDDAAGTQTVDEKPIGMGNVVNLGH